MDAQVILNAIATVGFPIVMCIFMCWYIMKTSEQHTKDLIELNEKHREEISDISAAINNNTLALQKLCDKLGCDD